MSAKSSLPIMDNELTHARFEQLNFLAQHIAQHLPDLHETGLYDKCLAKSIVRSEIVYYVVNGLYSLRNKAKVSDAMVDTDLIQVMHSKAALLPTDKDSIAKLKTLLVESLFVAQVANKRARVLTRNGKVISAQDASECSEFDFLNELIRLSVIAGYSEAGYQTFKPHTDVAPLRLLQPDAGSLRIANNLTLPEQKSTSFVISTDQDFYFSIFFNYSDNRKGTDTEILLIVNEEKYFAFDKIEENICYVRSYRRFTKSKVIVLNVKNGDRRCTGEAPIEAYKLVGSKLVSEAQDDALICAMIDYSTVGKLIAHQFGLKTVDSGNTNNKVAF